MFLCIICLRSFDYRNINNTGGTLEINIRLADA